MLTRQLLIILFSAIFVGRGMRLAPNARVAQAAPDSEQVCKVEEKKGHAQYGVSFSYAQGDLGCSDAKCEPFSFLTEAVPRLIDADPIANGKVCSCRTAELLGESMHLFDYYVSESLSDSKECSSKNCWTHYSDAFFMAKQVEVPGMSITEQLKRPDHWDMGCGLASEAVPMRGLIDLGSLVQVMSSKGGEHARIAKKIAGRVKLSKPIVDNVMDKITTISESNDEAQELQDADIAESRHPQEKSHVELEVDVSTTNDEGPNRGLAGSKTDYSDKDTYNRNNLCVERIEKLASLCHSSIVDFVEQCSITFDDFELEGLTQRGLERMCSNQDCLRKDAFAVPPTGFEELSKVCSDETSIRYLKQLGPAFRIATNLHVAWTSCERTSENVTSPISRQECPSQATVSLNCGWSGITPEQCTGKGCCWEPSDRSGRNWCYHTQSQTSCEKKCPSERWWQPAHREDCHPFLILDQFTDPDPVVRGNACRRVGCCWDELTLGSKEPWCFYQPCLA